MVSIMDVKPKRQVCDNRATLSQSAVSQKSIDLEIPIPLKSPTSTTSPISPASGASETHSPTTATSTVTDTELAKRAMKLDLIEVQSSSAASASGTSAASTTTNTLFSSSNSAATSTTAIIMKHRKLKERTFSDELGSPKSPAAAIGQSGATRPVVPPRLTPVSSTQTDVVDDRKALRDALYQGIFHRHRRTIFAVGSFLRMLKSRNSSYNTIRSSSEGEDDTR
ncbi:LOW QUALITY PROTEIN: uncharacterized protein LOC129775690 [Toxorhynchites rutilus septentrionalis]|uniref:LOW QUALITY PROTEIN: uncharacterized protein LOC129775690 n=1 Tax=Toxorhynchites rutilus septentrionalis TaxID=329112 RepID=UPI00247962FD|nr:LOW QUALITY PROTEIN: uncharacterized protein LOC129775690 [Toxorhynchites rutilus septentrionalis]